MSETAVYLKTEEAELFFKFRQFQDVWERFFDKNYTGSLKIDKCAEKRDIIFTWETKDKRELSTG
jgi:hypothetical protein